MPMDSGILQVLSLIIILPYGQMLVEVLLILFYQELDSLEPEEIHMHFIMLQMQPFQVMLFQLPVIVVKT
jgi:hypothetical protein